MIQHVVRGTTQTFYARVYDLDNELIDPTSIEAYVLPPGEAYPYEAGLTVTRQALGIYYVDITIDATDEVGTWNLYWRVQIGDEWYNESEEFSVDASADLFFDSDVLMVNQEYTITIDSSIRDALGVELGVDTDMFFFTELEPMYATVEDIRIEVGQYIANVPDYTIALKIWKASMYADNITYIRVPATGARRTYYNFAREQFVKAYAITDLLNLVVFNIGGGYKKVLGDLEITKFGAKLDDNPLLTEWAKAKKGWKWVVENGGEMTPDSAHKVGVAVKAGSHPNRPNIGRGYLIDQGVNARTVAEPTLGGSKTRAKNVKIKYANWEALHGS